MIDIRYEANHHAQKEDCNVIAENRYSEKWDVLIERQRNRRYCQADK